MILGIDLALRHTGIAVLKNDYSLQDIFVITTYNLEEIDIFLYYEKEFTKLFNTYNFKTINIEGLSFGALSSRKDIITGLFWYIKVLIFKRYRNNVELNIIPTLRWRNKVFTEKEKKQQREAKKQIKTLSKNDDNYIKLKQLIDIKYQTFLKLPFEIQTIIQQKAKNKTELYDMTDAYFIASFQSSKT